MVTMRLGRLPLVDSDRDLIYISGQPAYDIGTNPHEKTYPHMASFDPTVDRAENERSKKDN